MNRREALIAGGIGTIGILTLAYKNLIIEWLKDSFHTTELEEAIESEYNINILGNPDLSELIELWQILRHAQAHWDNFGNHITYIDSIRLASKYEDQTTGGVMDGRTMILITRSPEVMVHELSHA